jgi:tRNA nucleotidyltransferase (CCA-adding enzyme)
MLSIFLQKNLPFSLDLLPADTCLVGGSVRDALKKRPQAYLDLDFVLPRDAVKIAQKIAHQYHAGFVLLDRQRQIARVVFPDATIDFAQQEGETLIQDLQRRDFTINAIAYNPYSDQLVDPLRGRKDLDEGLIRMISEANLKDDPLRLLRAYRQASQLNFTIEWQTRLKIRELAPLLKKIAAERIRTELAYLLATAEGSKWLVEAYHDGLLTVWLENVTAEKVKRLTQIDNAKNFLGENWEKLALKSSNCDYLAKLAHLIPENPEIAERQLIKLKYSRTEIRSVVTILKYLPQLLKHSKPMSLREQYFFFLAVGEVFPSIAISAIALGINQEIISELINRYLDSEDRVAHPQPLITGNDLIKNLHISPSPKIGELLTKIQIAYIEGKIVTPNDALNLAASLLNQETGD